ncbi:hypothetical protein I0K15_15755 [Pontivivens ytuae]|uniref:Uncharacterized protein n=2 Tax=Pontivivens ytuae TaxID=2789856 RepID=A0A7S9LQG0_9RHOB|nr:hypothetical protein I0K15_15755 [Pontivivens ytuae]
MLDRTDPAETPEWRHHLGPGHVIAFAFPHADADEDEDCQTPKIRPCLVLDVEARDDERLALIAYGTSARTAANKGLEIHVRRIEDRLAAGLTKRTRFVCARRQLVPLRHPGFSLSAATGSPVLGRLAGNPMSVMNALRARLGARGEVAAAFRSREPKHITAARDRDLILQERDPSGSRRCINGQPQQPNPRYLENPRQLRKPPAKRTGVPRHSSAKCSRIFLRQTAKARQNVQFGTAPARRSGSSPGA